jgi:uncharacterized protein (DUF2336 family)
MANLALTSADVARLLADPSEGARVDTATKVAATLEQQNLSAEEHSLAESIIRTLAKDAEIAVRRAVMDSMKASRHLPRDVAERLATDVESIALPILQSSPMLSDGFLVEMVRRSGRARQNAIARRPQVSDYVVSSLIEHGDEEVVATLAANPGAEIAEYNMAYMLERFPASGMIATRLAARPVVPARVLEYLISVASEELTAQIKARPDYRPHMDDLVQQGRERATLRMLGRGRGDQELEELARQLLQSQRLTPSLVVRALCLGDIGFFEACLAVAAKVPLKNGRILIHDQGEAGLKAIYERTGLNINFLPAVRHALELAQEMDFNGGPDDIDRYRKRLVERILGDPQGMESEDIYYLLDKLSDLETNPW